MKDKKNHPLMVNINELTPKDRGRWVVYEHPGGSKEYGRLKSWRDGFLWVVYKCNDEWERYADFTGQCTFPDDVRFLTKNEEPEL